MNQNKTDRMLGNVRLFAHGFTRKPELTTALKAIIARSERLSGILFIGYPARTDAVLIADNGQTTVIDLKENVPANGHAERQDQAFFAVDRLLRMEPKLMDRRKPRIDVKTLTITTGIRANNPDHPEHPTVSTGSAQAKLEQFQTQGPEQPIDPELVLKSVLWMPPTPV